VEVDNEEYTTNMLENLSQDIRGLETMKKWLYDTVVEAFTIAENIYNNYNSRLSISVELEVDNTMLQEEPIGDMDEQLELQGPSNFDAKILEEALHE